MVGFKGMGQEQGTAFFLHCGLGFRFVSLHRFLGPPSSLSHTRTSVSKFSIFIVLFNI